VGVRYDSMMKRPTLKLTICRETLRVLSAMELAHIAGGDTPLLDTGNPGSTCRNAAIPDPGVGSAALAPKP
jgi:hypothetical protein